MKSVRVVRSIRDPRKGGLNNRGREIVVSDSAKVPINSLNDAPCGTRIKRAIKRERSRLAEHPPSIQKCREMSRKKRGPPKVGRVGVSTYRDALGVASCVEHQECSPRDAFAKG